MSVPAAISSEILSPSLSKSSSEGCRPEELDSKADLKPIRAAAEEAELEDLEEELDDELLLLEELAELDDELEDELEDELDDELLLEELLPFDVLLLDELVVFIPTPSNIVTSSSHPFILEELIRDRPAANTSVTRRAEGALVEIEADL